MGPEIGGTNGARLDCLCVEMDGGWLRFTEHALKVFRHKIEKKEVIFIEFH